MKKLFLLANILWFAFVANAQKPFVAHTVFDEANKVYAVKATPSSFLKFIDSTGEFLVKNVTNGNDYFGKGHTVRVVPPGQETTFKTKAEADALLDYWKQIIQRREDAKKKAPKYSE
jgi:hypothetical protein